MSEENLGRSIREEMERQPLHPLPPAPFMGAGLYALYYVGALPLYEGINDPNCTTPIYVGKAEAGTSSYGVLVPGTQTTNLRSRIMGHRNSIRQAHANLSEDDFLVRYLVTSDVHIVLGEAGLLQAYAPVLWNTVITGFGINAPGSGRDRQKRSRWDTLHPGRSRAANRPPNEQSVDELAVMVRRAIDARLRGGPIPADIFDDELDIDGQVNADNGV